MKLLAVYSGFVVVVRVGVGIVQFALQRKFEGADEITQTIMLLFEK